MSQGGIVWITGIPASGKTTLAGIVANKVIIRGGKAEVLDGDEIRQTISKGLGFSREDRRENVRRISWAARKLAKNDVWAVVAAVSPYREDREEAKKAAAQDGLYFLEVYLKCSVFVAKLRDRKGLYKMASEGSLTGMTGVDGPYEAPENAYTIDTAVDTAEEAGNRVFDAILWRPDDNPPTICIGRGHGGTRLVSKLMQDIGIFIGRHDQINGCDDSLDWVPLIYHMVEECGPVSEFKTGSQYESDIWNTARFILKNSHVSPGFPWGWKLPETTLLMPFFAEAFKKARFIHCIRHPVSSSLRGGHLTSDPSNSIGKASVYGAYEYCGIPKEQADSDPSLRRSAITWEHQTSRAMKYGRSLGADRYLDIKFEDICASPDWAMGTVERFLKARRSRVRPGLDIDQARTNKWDASDPNAEKIWEICGKTAKEAGYSFLDGCDPATVKPEVKI